MGEGSTMKIDGESSQPIGDSIVRLVDEEEDRGRNNISRDFDRLSKASMDTSNNDEGDNNNNNDDELAGKEGRAVTRIRIGLMLVLLAAAVSVSTLCFRWTSEVEQENFTTFFQDQATRLVDSFAINSASRIAAIESFAVSITSHAKYTRNTSSWPMVTMPNFERRGTAVSVQAQVLSMMLVPLVTADDRKDWETYSVEHQDWLAEGLQSQLRMEEQSRRFLKAGNETLQQTLDHDEVTQAAISQDVPNPFAIPEQIHRGVKGSNPTVPETGPGPYLPVWQMAPAFPKPSVVNMNVLAQQDYQAAANALLEAQVAIVGKTFDDSDQPDSNNNNNKSEVLSAGRKEILDLFLVQYQKLIDRSIQNGVTAFAEYQQDPVADIYVPVFDDFHQNGKALVALLTCVVYWRSYFVNILPHNAHDIHVVLENTCGQSYTYQINGAESIYLGPGDLHDHQFNSMELATDPGMFLPVNPDKRKIAGSCLYSIKVYPTEALKADYVTNKPAMYTGVLALIFVFTSLVFVMYDCLIERRQKVVMSTAVASNAIVSSLFPAVVRDRLYNQKEEAKSVKPKRSLVSAAAHNLVTKDTLDEANKSAPDKPIADLFQDCTVLFADIAGFTSWSSLREPADVFSLLETLYGSFDRIAKKRSVFKVETIGDCYLAVTGLPSPQEDHAERMVQFAYECLQKFTFLTQIELDVSFDTSGLSMRFGLHSGPVTAGVLRGEKSRFQLFGDTVNTAARMESTGEKGKIQVSSATADLLLVAGKGGWLDPKEQIRTQGNGQMQTYWVRVRNRDRNTKKSSIPKDSSL